jgi:uncharacterized RDD family membrane protein YckC
MTTDEKIGTPTDDVEYLAYLKKQTYNDLTMISLSINRQLRPERYAMVVAEIAERDKEPPPLPEENGFSGAGFWIRALARGIDTIFGLVLGLVGGLIGGIILAIMQITKTISPGWEHRIQGLTFMGVGLSILGGILYHSLTEGIHGASIGKSVCQLRVLQQDGQPSNMKGAAIRSLAWLIDGMFFGIVGWCSMEKSPLRQRNGDVWGRTIVVKTKDIPVNSKRSFVVFLFGVCLGATCWLCLLVLGLVLKAR